MGESRDASAKREAKQNPRLLIDGWGESRGASVKREANKADLRGAERRA
jgi:hypothetical protein